MEKKGVKFPQRLRNKLKNQIIYFTSLVRILTRRYS